MKRAAAILTAWLFLADGSGAPSAWSYVLNYTVADMRQPSDKSGGTACPQLVRVNAIPGRMLDRRWSTSLNATTIFTQDQSPSGRLNEIESAVFESFWVWTAVTNTAVNRNLNPNALGPLTRTPIPSACSSFDGMNTICFNQPDAGFTLGVLAFTRLVTSDVLGQHPFPNKPPASFIGEILDADILFSNDGAFSFATPAALPNHPSSYDLESVLTHELGHFFGFNHSGVWRAMMYPFAPPVGQFSGNRPTPQVPDGPLSDDDRTGLRALYPDPSDTVNVGSLSGRILPANPLSLPTQPPAVSGIFGTHVVAIDNATGAVVAGTLGGWSCKDPGPVQFDGFYLLERLPLGRRYKTYVQPFDGAVNAGDISVTTESLCRNPATDPGWPPPFACTAPAVNTNFAMRVRPAAPP